MPSVSEYVGATETLEILDSKSQWRLGARLFFALAVISMVNLYFSNLVLPPSAMARLAEQQTGISTAASQIERIAASQWIGYLLAPVGLALKLGVVALVVQAMGLLLAPELKFVTAFTAASAGGFAAMYDTWMNLFWIWRTGPNRLSLDHLAVAPVSLAGWFFDPESSRTVLYQVAAEISLGTLMWIALVALILQSRGRLRWGPAIAVGGVTWLVLAAIRTALSAAAFWLVA